MQHTSRRLRPTRPHRVRLVPPWLLGAVLVGLLGWHEAAAQWIEVPGRGWAQVSAYHHSTMEQFDPDGMRAAFGDGEGESIATSVFLTGTVGLVRGVDAWVQVPYHRLQYRDASGTRTASGISDVRLYLRAGAPLFGLDVPVAVRAGAKLPGKAMNDRLDDAAAATLAIGDGQLDVEVIGEVGWAAARVPVYAIGWLGYRWRTEDDATGWTPGNEWFGLVGVGESGGRFGWKLTAEFLVGGDPRFEAAEPAPEADAALLSRRELVQLAPSGVWNVGPGSLEAGLRLPVAGRNQAAGPAVFAGYFWRWR